MSEKPPVPPLTDPLPVGKPAEDPAVRVLVATLERMRLAGRRKPEPKLELSNEELADELLYASWWVAHPGVRALMSVCAERLRRIGDAL